jgi:hypothetical protein
LAVDLLRNLPPQSEMALLSFADQADVILPSTSEVEKVEEALAELTIEGRYTVLHDALFDASKYLRSKPYARRAILLITDGKDENSAVNLEDSLKVAQDAKIPIFTIGVGRIQTQVLRRIAKLTGGEYTPVREARGYILASMMKEKVPSVPPESLAQVSETPPIPAPTEPTMEPDALAPLTPRLLPWLAASGALLSAGALAVWLWRRRSALHPCLTCGRLLPAGAPCPDCARVQSPSDEPSVDLTLPQPPQSYPETQPLHSNPTIVQPKGSIARILDRTMRVELKEGQLTIQQGHGAGQVFKVSPKTATLLGRSPLANIPCTDPTVSNEHCRISPERGFFMLHDLDSTNGTFVNGQRINQHVLQDGDIVKVGETNLEFRAG